MSKSERRHPFSPKNDNGLISTQKVDNLLTNVTTQDFMTSLEDIFVTNRIVAFKRYNFICRKQKKSESLEQFHADLVELASRADCGNREDEWVRDMFTAHMCNERIAEELLAQTRSPQEAHEYAIRRGKGIEHSSTMKINPFGGQPTTKQDPVHYINTRGGRITKTHKEVGVVSADDHIHVDHKTQEDNKEITLQTLRNNVINAEINTIRIIFNLVRLKTNFVQNAPNEAILQ